MTSRVPPVRLVASPKAEIRDIDPAAGWEKARQLGGDHHRGDVAGIQPRLIVPGIDPQAFQHADQRLPGEDRVSQPVPGAGQADHQAVADQLVLANALDIGDVLDAHLGVGRQSGGEREYQSEQANEPDQVGPRR